MAKQCSVDGCTNPVFAKNLCKYHQYKRKLATKKSREGKYTKEKRKSLKRAYIKPRANKKPKVDFGFNTQIEMFNFIWKNEPHVCFLTGKPIKKYDLRIMAHCLRKGRYTYWKLNPDNIRLLQPYVHHAVDNYEDHFPEIFPEIDFKKWFDLQEEMKIKYEEFKRKNLLA